MGLRTGNILGDGFGVGRAWKGKDPPVFSGRPLEFSEWQFAIEEALAVVPPADQVRFAVSYLGGDARRWFMTAYPDGERPNDWTSLRNGLRAAFSPDGERAFHRTKLLRIRQVGSLENYIAEFRSLCISSSKVDELTKAILFTEGLKVELCRAVKQAQAETLQTAVRAARAAAECEPELIQQDNSSSSSLYASESDVGKNKFSRRPTSIASVRERQNTIRCFNCGRLGHIARFCRGNESRNRVTRRNRERPQENVTGELGVLVEPNLNMEHELLVLKGTVNGVPVSCLIDSGASHNFSRLV